MVAHRSNSIVSARVRDERNYLERESGEVHGTGNLECEREKNEHAQLLSDLDHRRQIRSIHLGRSAFTDGGCRQE